MHETTEHTNVTFLGRFDPYDTETSGGLGGIIFDGSLSPDELREALVEAGVPQHGGYAMKHTTKEFNWGGFTLIEEFLVEIPQSVSEEAFWVLVGYVIDRIRTRIKGTTHAPSEESAAHTAIAHILVAFPDENRESIAIVGDGLDSGDQSRRVILRSSSWSYRVDIRETPKGYPFVVAHERARCDVEESGQSTA